MVQPDAIDIEAYSTTDVRACVADMLARGTPHDALMHRAAAGLAAVCVDELRCRVGRIYGTRVVLLVGSGNNGADALFAGTRLRRRGVRVDAVPVGTSLYQPALHAFTAAGGRVVEIVGGPGGMDRARAGIERADLVVDGIVGDRGRGGLSGPAADIAGFIAEMAIPIPMVAADLPSGVDPDTGELPGPYIGADVTVTFGVAKPCLLLPPASRRSGRIVVVDVGLPPMRVSDLVAQQWALATVADEWPIPDRTADKYSRGVLGVVAGSERYPGAGVLACSAAVRTGVGMVRYVGPPSCADRVLAAAPEVVTGAGRVQAWMVGSGIPTGVESEADRDAAVTAALDGGLPCVVDAGALPECVRQRARGLRAAAGDRILLTPHAGELAELLGMLGHRVTRDTVIDRPVFHSRLLAEQTDATVLLKGSTTIIVGPRGPVACAAQAPSWLATAGTGDVLAGIAGALLASGSSAYFAGYMAAVMHGRAAHAACPEGPVSAATVAAAVPTAVARLLTHRRLRE